MNLHSYSIATSGNIILVNKYGNLSMTAQLAYLSELAQTIDKFHGQPYYLLADLRGWTVGEENRALIMATDIHFDRRSQKGECWLVDNLAKTDYLLRFFKDVRFELVRTTLIQDATRWAEVHFNEDQVAGIYEWLNQNTAKL